jgi:hypothetical protein
VPKIRTRAACAYGNSQLTVAYPAEFPGSKKGRFIGIAYCRIPGLVSQRMEGADMEIRKTPHQSAILFLLTVMAYPGFSQAQESALFGSEWEASLALFFPKVDTNIRVDSQGGLIGTEINLETLGLDQSRVLPALGLAWQPNARHSLWLDYFQPDRSGFSTAAVTIRVGETEFPLNAELSTIFNAKVLAMGYGYSFVNDADRIFGFRIGLNVQDLKFGIATTDGLQQETAQGTAPLQPSG